MNKLSVAVGKVTLFQRILESGYPVITIVVSLTLTLTMRRSENMLQLTNQSPALCHVTSHQPISIEHEHMSWFLCKCQDRCLVQPTPL